MLHSGSRSSRTNLSFGFAELGANFSGTLHDHDPQQGRNARHPRRRPNAAGPGSRSGDGRLSAPASVTVPANGQATLNVTLTVPAASVWTMRRSAR